MPETWSQIDPERAKKVLLLTRTSPETKAKQRRLFWLSLELGLVLVGADVRSLAHRRLSWENVGGMRRMRGRRKGKRMTLWISYQLVNQY